MKKRWLGILLALCLLVCFAPAALAAETEPSAGPTEVYVSSTGSDESGTGSHGSPYATLAKAAEYINGQEIGGTYHIYVMSDLTSTACARFYDCHVTISSYGNNSYTVSRGDNFEGQHESSRNWYNPSLLEIGKAKTENDNFVMDELASLTLENITFDDAGKTMGQYYLQAGIEGLPDGATSGNIVQDAIIATYSNTSEIILGDGAILKDYGGMSAVHLASGTLIMKSGSKIYDENVTDRIKGKAGSFGPAGAVWMQGGTFTMEEGAEISDMVGRAVFADPGKVTIHGTISDIVSDTNMWEGENGFALYSRDEGSVTVGETGKIENNGKPRQNTGVVIYLDRVRCVLNGSVENCNANDIISILNSRQSDGFLCELNGNIIGNTAGSWDSYPIILSNSDAIISDTCRVEENTGAFSILLASNGSHVKFYGHIDNNNQSTNGGGFGALQITSFNASNGPTCVEMLEGSTISNNRTNSRDKANAVCVTNSASGTVNRFIMLGGEIYGNTGATCAVHVEKNASFTMKGGKISNNDGYGISMNIRDRTGCFVDLEEGIIIGNGDDGSPQLADSNFIDGANTNSERLSIAKDNVSLSNRGIDLDDLTITLAENYDDVKLGNVGSDNESTLVNESKAKGWQNALATFWMESETAQELTLSGLSSVDSTLPIYALVMPTGKDGDIDDGSSAAVYAVIGNGDDTYTLNLPVTYETGWAVALVQPSEDYGTLTLTPNPETLQEGATSYSIQYTATFEPSESFKSELASIDPVDFDEFTLTFTRDNRLTGEVGTFTEEVTLDELKEGFNYTVTVTTKDGTTLSAGDQLVTSVSLKGSLPGQDLGTPVTLVATATVTVTAKPEDPIEPTDPPYIPPVDPDEPADPDDTGVSDLLNTEDHIQYLFGYPDGTFGPENNMTRAEVAQMFYNLLLDQDVEITKTFDDVPANAWYAKAVNTLASLDIISGVGDNKFEPERSITRAEFTAMAMKFAVGGEEGENIFSDVDENDWFYDAVVNSIQYGWIHGYGDGTFRPNNPITRAEVTAIVNNMLGRAADEDFVDEHAEELTPFSDIEKHWAYYHIVEATNDHDYTKPSSGENWTKLN